MALLEVQDLRVAVDGRDILNGVSLGVEAAQVHCLVGPNGAGKSTLAYALMGMPGYEPRSGRVVFDGRDIGHLAIDERARAGLTLAWQEPARFEGLSVRKFLSAGARNGSEEQLRDALQQVALNPDDYLDRPVDRSLSGGERKRIELASILVMEPKLIILDEPDSGIDVAALRKIFELLASLKERGMASLLVTHSAEVLRHADMASLICCGYIAVAGSPNEVDDYFSTGCIPCPYHD
ncbi:MAG: ABC transporter ATP-binding protein [Candidatus Brocadiia bacterium]